MYGRFDPLQGQPSCGRVINEFLEWYCSEPRLSLNGTVVLRYRILLTTARSREIRLSLRHLNLLALLGITSALFAAMPPAPVWNHKRWIRKQFDYA